MPPSARVWIYTVGSVQLGACGAAAIFEDPHGLLARPAFNHTWPLQSSTNAEIAGIRLALDHLSSQTDWRQVYIVSDSQAALLQLSSVDGRPTRASIWEVQRQALALCQAGTMWSYGGLPDMQISRAMRQLIRGSCSCPWDTLWDRALLSGAAR